MKFIMFILRLGIGTALVGLCLASFAALFGFANPLLDAINHGQPVLFFGTLTLLIIVALIFRAPGWRSGLLAFGATGFIASAVVVVPEHLASNFVQPGELGEQQIYKLLSHNLFGLNQDMGRMASIIDDEAPDIIALQEYFGAQKSGLHPRIVDKYPFFSHCVGRKGAQIALYAKMPFELIQGTQCTDAATRSNSSVARLVAQFEDSNANSFNVVITHLNWPVQASPLFQNNLNLHERLGAVTARKQKEWAELGAAINALEGPVVVAGDFNSTSWSYAMRQFLDETNLIRHSRGLFTFPKVYYIMGWREVPAFLPIDHFMASGDVQVQSVRRGGQTGSDHLPIYGVFSLSK